MSSDISFPDGPAMPPQERRAGTFRAATALAFLSGMAIIVLMGWLSYRATTTLVENSSWISHTQEVLSNLHELQSRLERAESAQGRYLLTGNESFLATFQDDVETSGVLYERLVRLTSDNAEQQVRLRDLRGSIDSKIEHMKGTMQIRRTAGMTPEIQQRVS